MKKLYYDNVISKEEFTKLLDSIDGGYTFKYNDDGNRSVESDGFYWYSLALIGGCTDEVITSVIIEVHDVEEEMMYRELVSCGYKDSRLVDDFYYEADEDDLRNIKNYSLRMEQYERFTNHLYTVSFEDGMRNDSYDEFEKLYNENKEEFCLYLDYLVVKYRKDSKHFDVINGILRLISKTVDDKECRDLLFYTVSRCLRIDDTCIQESTIMVVEEWRNAEFIPRLKRTKFKSDWLEKYANDIVLELEEENHNKN